MERCPNISIIIPVYNAEPYLKECVESILAQTYENFELILVDDGSLDKSGEMCDVFAREDERIHVLHKNNGGATSARKMGVEKARGEWILFSDADDKMPLDSIEDLVSYDDGSFDIISGTINYEGIRIIRTETEKERLSSEEYICLLLLRKSYFGPCSKLIRKSLFNQVKWLEDNSIFQNEDLFMLISLSCNCTNHIAIANTKIHYICKLKGESVSARVMNYKSWYSLFYIIKQTLVEADIFTKSTKNAYVDYVLWILRFYVLSSGQLFRNYTFISDFKGDMNSSVVSKKNRLASLCVNYGIVRFLAYTYVICRTLIRKMMH